MTATLECRALVAGYGSVKIVRHLPGVEVASLRGQLSGRQFG